MPTGRKLQYANLRTSATSTTSSAPGTVVTTYGATCGRRSQHVSTGGDAKGGLVLSVVTIYEDVNFGGNGILLDVGDYRLFGASEMNDTVSSIQVPAGMVALVFEHADSSGGYGISADLLEDCADLRPLGLDNKISYITVFTAERPENHVWRRGAFVNGEYIPGHWARKSVVEPPPNHVVTVSPPIPRRTGGIAVHASGPQAKQAQSLYTVFLHGPDDPRLPQDSGRFDASLTCTFPTLSLGHYRVTVDTKADVPFRVTPSQVGVECQARQVAQVIFRFG
jgi:hypothetical protein